MTHRTSAIVRIGLAIPLVLAFTYSLVGNFGFFFDLAPNDAIRKVYGRNPFPESVEIARYIREHSSPDDTIAILGSEPQIFFYSQRRSTTSTIYTYPLMESSRFAHSMQENMIREIEAGTPKFILFVDVPTSWLVRPNSDLTILRWAEQYLSKNYEQEGITDLLHSGRPRYLWGPDAKNYEQEGITDLLPGRHYLWSVNAENYRPDGRTLVSTVLYRRKHQGTKNDSILGKLPRVGKNENFFFLFSDS